MWGQKLRHRAVDPPVGRKVGYHEEGDDKEEGDVDWMLGEASTLSGAGTRGSSNWVLKVMVPILVRGVRGARVVRYGDIASSVVGRLAGA